MGNIMAAMVSVISAPDRPNIARLMVPLPQTSSSIQASGVYAIVGGISDLGIPGIEFRFWAICPHFMTSNRTPMMIHIQSHPTMPVGLQLSMYMMVVYGANNIPSRGQIQAPRQTTSHLALKSQARMSINRGANTIANEKKQPRSIISNLPTD
jgi:hypothetical protein